MQHGKAWESTADYIARQTMIYWSVSGHCNGTVKLPQQVEKKLTASSVIHLCNDLLANLNPHRPISKRVYHLQQAIIKGGKRARNTNTAKLLTFEPRKSA